MQGVPKIPYFQTSRYRVNTMVELAKAKPGEVGADLGTGDGRIAIAFAQTGIEMHAYEIDDNLREQAKKNINRIATKNIILHNQDFWTVDLSHYSFVCCYPMPAIMGRLEKKLQGELQPGSRVLLNYFPFFHWKEKAIKDNIYLYQK